MANQQIPQKIADAISKKDFAGLANLYNETAVVVQPFFPEGLKGREAIRQAEQQISDSFTDIEVRVERVVADGRVVAAEMVCSAKNSAALKMPNGTEVPATNKRIQVRVHTFLEIDEKGLIVEEHRLLDVANMMQQLGLLPQA